MQNKKQRLISALSTLALTFVLSSGLTPPGTAPENPNPAFPQLPVEEEAPGTDGEEEIHPLTNLEDTTTKIEE
ncbi:MAG: hypothetical protein HFH84_00745 [Lachnospiraceae bacterium]|jgi:hypothetical protein|nr:hypothetical protein [Lachnospiraceae bacterium]